MVTEEELDAWYDLVSYKTFVWNDLTESRNEIYISKHNNTYLNHVSFKWDLLHLCELGITEQVTNETGFAPSTQKWYGYTHRGCCSFGIGSSVDKTDCAYVAKNKQDFIEEQLYFWSVAEENKTDFKVTEITDDGFQITWKFTDDPELREDFRNRVSGIWTNFPEKYGRGEWVAETLDDARQMAIDYADSVS